MTKAGKSVFYFGIFALVVGILACLVPGQLISMLKLPVIPTGWARVFGLVVVVIGMYDLVSGFNNIKLLIKATVYMRLFFFAGIMTLFITGQMPKEIVPLGIIDLAGAAWTMIALRTERVA